MTDTGDERLKAIAGNVPLGRLANPMRSPRPWYFWRPTIGSYITGTELFVNGGFAQV